MEDFPKESLKEFLKKIHGEIYGKTHEKFSMGIFGQISGEICGQFKRTFRRNFWKISEGSSANNRRFFLFPWNFSAGICGIFPGVFSKEHFQQVSMGELSKGFFEKFLESS